jgi:hypothetical protein
VGVHHEPKSRQLNIPIVKPKGAQEGNTKIMVGIALEKNQVPVKSPESLHLEVWISSHSSLTDSSTVNGRGCFKPSGVPQLFLSLGYN